MREETKNLRRAQRFGFVATALFLALGVFSLTSLSALAYRGILRIREDTRQSRTVMSYIRSQVCYHDRSGAVVVDDTGTRLTLREQGGEQVYELRIYAYNGNLLEEYAAADSPSDPEKGTVIGKTESFSAQWLRDNLLCVSTDSGELLIYLGAAGEGDAA